MATRRTETVVDKDEKMRLSVWMPVGAQLLCLTLTNKMHIAVVLILTVHWEARGNGFRKQVGNKEGQTPGVWPEPCHRHVWLQCHRRLISR